MKRLLPRAVLASLVPLTAIASEVESSQQTAAHPAGKYDFQFIAVDDLSNWFGCLGGRTFFLARGIANPICRGLFRRESSTSVRWKNQTG